MIQTRRSILLRIPPQDRDGDIEETQFYNYIKSLVGSDYAQYKLTDVVKAYMNNDFNIAKLPKMDVERLRNIWEHYWYAQYNGVEKQSYIQ